jgi:membrane protease YdiL (CAAX protease family)
MEESVRGLIALGLTLLLVMLRLEAARFGAAEYAETDEPARGRALWYRFAWYAMGVAGIAAIVWIHPDPIGELNLGMGTRTGAIGLGFLIAIGGGGQAALFAWARYRRLRLPDPASYPGALINDVGTALIDEVVFRGALLGFLLATGLRPDVAIVIGALIYTLTTRLGAPGRDRYRFVLSLAIGLVGGWATVVTGGIGAAFLGHAVTRFSVFLCTGHHGQLAPRGGEAEDVERRRRPPEGWRVIAPRERSTRER